MYYVKVLSDNQNNQWELARCDEIQRKIQYISVEVEYWQLHKKNDLYLNLKEPNETKY